MPAMKSREEEPKKKPGEIEVEEETPYVFQPYTPDAWAAYAVPRSWIYIPDDLTLEAVLSDGRPKSLVVVAPARVLSAERRLDFERVVRKVKDGYAVWVPPSEVSGMVWLLEHGRPYRSIPDLITHPASLVGMGLRGRPKSTLYYRVGKAPADFDQVLKRQEEAARKEAEDREKAEKEYWKRREEASARQKRAMGVRRARTIRLVGAGEPEPKSGEETEEENPMSEAPDDIKSRLGIAGRVVSLRKRRFNTHYGAVFLARVWDDARGNYLVWSDTQNTFYSGSEFDRRYGWPAVFDPRFYAHYGAALDDYLTRRTQRRPVPLGG